MASETETKQEASPPTSANGFDLVVGTENDTGYTGEIKVAEFTDTEAGKRFIVPGFWYDERDIHTIATQANIAETRLTVKLFALAHGLAVKWVSRPFNPVTNMVRFPKSAIGTMSSEVMPKPIDVVFLGDDDGDEKAGGASTPA